MLEKLREIDTTIVEELVKLEQEQDVLQGYLRRAEELKDRVENLVYQKVRSDYESRLKSLEEKAFPLRAEVRKQHEKLRSLHAELTSTCEGARLEKEEIEFRRSVGEVGDKDLAERLGSVEEVLKRCRSELAQVDELRKTFLKAFPKEEDLGAGAVVPPTVALQSDAGVRGEIRSRTGREPRKEPATARSSDVSPDKTTVLPAGVGDKAVESGSPMADASSSSVPPPGATEVTVVLPEAVLAIKSGRSTKEYRLTTFNNIGRADDNHICIKGRSVSRRHALITATPAGFHLKDLESRGGTFVNGKRITECSLTDGDQIKIGEVQLVFRSSKASSGSGRRSG